MGEHLATLDLTAAGTYKFAIPKDGTIKGVYSSSAITIGYDDNGSIGTLIAGTAMWEPVGAGFQPAPIAYLVLTTTAAAKVSIRYEL